MIQPKPYKLVCIKCNYKRVVILKSDCLDLEDLKNSNPICPKCKTFMKKTNLTRFDYICRLFKI